MLIPLVPKLSMSPKLIKKVKRLLEAPFTVFVVNKYRLWTIYYSARQYYNPDQLKETV